MVGAEELEVQKMTCKPKKGSKRKRQKTALNRSILDVGIGGLRQVIKYKVEEAGGMFVEVPTKKVKLSQTCPKCLHQKKKNLSERIHICENCIASVLGIAVLGVGAAAAKLRQHR